MLAKLKPFLLHPFLPILAATLFIYSPLLSIPFRDSDQVVYFANTGPQHSLIDGLKQYDYSASRLYWKGDDMLFRPLLFVLQAFETYIFSYHYIFWNALNILLHLLVLFVFYNLLLRISPEKNFAALFCALFAFSKAPVGLVANTHLGGYLAGFALYLGTLTFFYSSIKNAGADNSSACLYGILGTFTVFFYELTLPYLMAASFFWVLKKRGKMSPQTLFWLLLPLISYISLYAFHLMRVQRPFYASSVDTPSILAIQNFISVPENMWYMTKEFLRDIFPNPRIFKILFAGTTLGLFYPGLLWKPSLGLIQKVYPLLILFFYTGALALLRATFWRDYYPYFFHLFLALAFYSWISFPKLTSGRRKIISIIMLLLITWNAASVWQYYRQIGEGYFPIHHYFNRLNHFVDAHRGEPGFSFQILKTDKELDPPYELKEGYPDGSEEVFTKTASEILYSRYYTTESPKYRLQWREGDFSI